MEKDLKYKIKQNNYIGLLFFALVLASTLYIIKHETESFKELEPPSNNIILNEKNPTILLEENEQIKELRNYLNLGDSKTFKVYQSMYINNDVVSVDDLNTENLLYLAYKYIAKTTDFSNYLNYITCDDARSIGIENEIIQCGGSKVNTSYYMVNSYINKELLKNTIRKLYNINIQSFTNFYTTSDNLCYFVNDDYICVNKTGNTINGDTVKTEFVKAIKSDKEIQIIEKYKNIKEGIYYKGFNSSEIGEEFYISTFNKINGEYYWSETKVYQED